jgi:hypothetical protein
LPRADIVRLLANENFEVLDFIGYLRAKYAGQDDAKDLIRRQERADAARLEEPGRRGLESQVTGAPGRPAWAQCAFALTLFLICGSHRTKVEQGHCKERKKKRTDYKKKGPPGNRESAKTTQTPGGPHER